MVDASYGPGCVMDMQIARMELMKATVVRFMFVDHQMKKRDMVGVGNEGGGVRVANLWGRMGGWGLL